jgi:hypothetical protein
MKMKSLLSETALVLGLLFILPVSTATAGSMGNGAAQRMKLVVASVDATAGTIELKSGVDQTVHDYKIGATTRISIAAHKGTIDQIKVGMKVVNFGVASVQTPGVTPSLTMIMLYPAAPAPVAPAPATPNP